jgi:hypothetical protein
MARTTLACIGYLSAIVGVPWLTAACIFFLALRFRAWEAVFLGFFMDLFWLPLHVSLYTLPYGALFALVAVWGLEPLRARLLR